MTYNSDGELSLEEIGLIGKIGQWRNDPLTKFLRFWLCRGVWNSEPPLHIDPRELEDRVGRLVMAQKILDSWANGSDGLTVREPLHQT